MFDITIIYSAVATRIIKIINIYIYNYKALVWKNCFANKQERRYKGNNTLNFRKWYIGT